MTQTTSSAAVAFVVGSAVALTGCSTNIDDTVPRPTASGTPTARASTPVTETIYDRCESGVATILTSNTDAGETFELGDCASVSIVGFGALGSTFELGEVDTLVVEGDAVRVSVASAEKIVVVGQRNTITYGGEAVVEDHGARNRLTAKRPHRHDRAAHRAR